MPVPLTPPSREDERADEPARCCAGAVRGRAIADDGTLLGEADGVGFGRAFAGPDTAAALVDAGRCWRDAVFGGNPVAACGAI